MDETDAFPHVAAAVASEAARLGIARRRRTRDEYYEEAKRMMARTHALARELARSGFVAPMPDEPRNEPK
jgi:hypothetical protein